MALSKETNSWLSYKSLPVSLVSTDTTTPRKPQKLGLTGESNRYADGVVHEVFPGAIRVETHDTASYIKPLAPVRTRDRENSLQHVPIAQNKTDARALYA